MIQSLIVKRPFCVQKPGRERAATTPSVASVPRVARLMALAIHFDQIIRDGIIADQAEIARLGHASRARLTQIMNLSNLSPEIQEELLFFADRSGRTSVFERTVRTIATDPNWKRQRLIWSEIRRIGPCVVRPN